MELTATRFGYAKVNPALRITGIGEGYHLLDTILLRAPLYDAVTVTLSDASQKNRVEYSDGSVYAQDNVLRALEVLSEEGVEQRFSVRVTKNIPEGKGLGASSAAAAASVRAVGDLIGRSFSDETWVRIGADAKFQASDMPAARAAGAGEKLTEWLPKRSIYVAFAATDAKSDTAKVFAAYDLLGGAGGDTEEFVENFVPFNELEVAAVAVNPGIAAARRALSGAGYEHIAMTGSGSGYIGLSFDPETHARRFAALQKLVRGKRLTIYDFQGSAYDGQES